MSPLHTMSTLLMKKFIKAVDSGKIGAVDKSFSGFIIMAPFTLLSLIAICFGSTIGLDTTIEIDQGKLLGIASVGLDDVPYVSYMGIPYAKQPVGDLRFRPPESPESWEGIRNATIERATCIQTIWGLEALTIRTEPDQEACLYINVHTPANCSSDNLPVYVWIHGGAFAYGSGNRDLSGPDYLVSKGVIVVTFNYRLNVFGYLSLDIPEAPGNIGLRDQVAALRWTRDNIAAFGGNPDNVTLGGISAGAVSAHILSLLPVCEGLFQRVILTSGNAFDPWAMSLNNSAIAFEMGSKLNYTTTNATELYNLLRTANVSDLYEAGLELVDEKGLAAFQVVVEKEFDGVEPLLTEHPYDIMKAGNQNDVKYLMGYTDREGISVYAKLSQIDIIDVLNSSPARWLPDDVDQTNLTSAEIVNSASEIKSFYLGDQNASDSTINQLIDWTGQPALQYKDVVFSRVRSSVSDTPVYLYNFAYDGNYTFIKTTLNLTEYKGVPHYEDSGYLFKINSFPGTIEAESTDDKVRRTTLEMWTNFIKYGDPTPEVTDLLPVKWLPTSGFNITYMKIDSTLTLHENTLPQEFAFWDKIYTELGYPIQ